MPSQEYIDCIKQGRLLVLDVRALVSGSFSLMKADRFTAPFWEAHSVLSHPPEALLLH